MKVKFLKNGPGFGFGYMAGATADIDAKKAAELIKLKVVAAAEDGAGSCELPEQIPHRSELEKAGINSLDDLAKYAEDYTAITGVGKSKATDIEDFIKALPA